MKLKLEASFEKEKSSMYWNETGELFLLILNLKQHNSTKFNSKST